MTLRERFEQLFYKKQEETRTPERRKIEPLKPIYADKPSVSATFASSHNSMPSFNASPVDLDNWNAVASRELPDSEYYLQHFSPEQLKELVVAHRRGHDIAAFADPEQTPEQLHFIYTHAEFGEDVSKYIYNTEFDPARIEKSESAQFLMDVIDTHQKRKEQKTSPLKDLISAAEEKKVEIGTGHVPVRSSGLERG